jgi:hypothetical protein
MPEISRAASIRFQEECYLPYDAMHGTPHAMVRRLLEFELPEGKAHWEQTDYGHPGRFNDWDPRGIDARLQPKTAQLRAAAEAIGALLE